MALEQKIAKAILSAKRYLENSQKSIAENNQDTLANYVWKASAELEYALFLFTVLLQDEDRPHSWKVNLKSRELELAPVITSTQELVANAQTHFQDGDLQEAQKTVWLARGYLLEVQNFLEKRRQ